MGDSKPVTPAELAARTGTNERYVREWLNANAASGYVTYDAAAKTYTLPPEQALALAVENSPVFLPGAFQIISACFNDEGKIEDAFRTGKGVGWHEHHHDLFHGTERFFRPGYIANLTSSWIPALEGVEAKLRSGAKVADIGCGLGASTILMAKAFPKSEFFGFDYHEGSIALAREAAKREGVDGPAALRGRVGEGLSRARATTSSRSSTACTIWAIRPARRRMSTPRWRAMGRG